MDNVKVIDREAESRRGTKPFMHHSTSPSPTILAMPMPTPCGRTGTDRYPRSASSKDAGT